MAKYTSKRTSYNSTYPNTRKKVHQTTVVFDQDTIAFLKQQSRKNADFNRRVAALDRIYDDSSSCKQQINSKHLNNYRIQTDTYSRRRTNSSSGRASSPNRKSVLLNQHSRNTPSSQTKSKRNTHRNYDHDYYEDGYKRPSKGTSNNSRTNSNATKYKKKKKLSKALIIVLAVMAVLLAIIAFVGVNVVITKNHASHLKDDLEKVLECAKEKDADGAETALLKSIDDREKLATSLSSSFWTTASRIDRVKEELNAGNELLGVVQTAQDDILTPLVALMKRQPLTDLKVGEDGFNVTLINNYLDFVEEIQPDLESLMSKIMAVDTDSMMGGYVAKYKDKLYKYTDAYNEASSMLPLLRVFLGDGEDRLYLFVAQNSAEIRASGGFPGSIGTIQIKDGVLTIGDFETVYHVLADTVSYRSDVTDSELNIFGSWINAPRDACFIPAFDRAAEIWAVAYEDHQREKGAIDTYEGYVKANTYYDEWNEQYYFDGVSEDEYNEYYTGDDVEYIQYVDGVVSLTPAIIQMLMEDIGEITLSDGSILNSTNATKMLQYELYHKYFDIDNVTLSSDWTADGLFAETAKSVMKEFVSDFEISKFADYYKLFQKGKEKNIIQMWMADEEEEEIITESGFSGKLNFDKENPQIGIYFSLADPSKMGWYLDMIPEISEPIINDDGCLTYDVTVTLRNVIDDYDISRSHEYIIGGYNGGIRGYIHCFAPAGGYITDIEADNWMYMFEANYNDLEVYYDLDVLLEPGEEVKITYKVTTAEGVETPLKAVTTPTLTEYR